jgi:hypothetical protein
MSPADELWTAAGAPVFAASLGALPGHLAGRTNDLLPRIDRGRPGRLAKAHRVTESEGGLVSACVTTN